MDTLRKSGIQKRPLIAFGGLVIFVIVAILTMEIQDRQESERFKALSPTEHLALAKKFMLDFNYEEAIRHLEAIPSTAALEGAAAVRLLVDARTRELQRQAAENARQQQRREEQNSQLDSYWPTTIRVQTDMNSFWLDQEERMCVSYPDAYGKVIGVHCEGSASKDSHNIPVTFWAVLRGESPPIGNVVGSQRSSFAEPLIRVARQL